MKKYAKFIHHEKFNVSGTTVVLVKPATLSAKRKA